MNLSTRYHICPPVALSSGLKSSFFTLFTAKSREKAVYFPLFLYFCKNEPPLGVQNPKTQQTKQERDMNFELLFLGKIGATELILLVLLVVILFGGKKIPELMRGLGRGVKEFKDAANKDYSEENKSEKKQEQEEKGE